MKIDARDMSLDDILKRLRDILCNNRCEEINIEIIIEDSDSVKKVCTFLKMSGCKTDVIKKDSEFMVYASGYPCCT